VCTNECAHTRLGSVCCTDLLSAQKAHIYLYTHQGCSVRIFGSKFDNSRESYRTVQCAISKMEDFAGYGGRTRPKHAFIVLNTYNLLQVISAQKLERLTAI